MNNAAKNFDILAIGLNVLHNYFDGLTKLFSTFQILTKFLNTLTKSRSLRVIFRIYIKTFDVKYRNAFHLGF